MKEVTLSSYFPKAIIEIAKEYGLSPQKLLQRARIPAKLFSQADVRITAAQYAALQTITMREMNDEILGFTRQAMPIGSWSALCHWLILSRNLGQALKRLCHFYTMMDKGLDINIASKYNTTSLNIAFDNNHLVSPYGYENVLFTIHRLICWLAEDRVPIVQVRLPYSKPQHANEYRVMLPRAEVLFDSEDCTMVFDQSIRERKIKQTPDSLAAFLAQPLLNMLTNDYNQQSWTIKTQNIIRENLINIPNLTDVAKALDIHPKKLRKELEMEGISYGNLKGQLRRDIAIDHLTKSQQSIEQIAYLTGFSETCTFTRAFKRWTGVTPFSYRKLENESNR